MIGTHIPKITERKDTHYLLVWWAAEVKLTLNTLKVSMGKGVKKDAANCLAGLRKLFYPISANYHPEDYKETQKSSANYQVVICALGENVGWRHAWASFQAIVCTVWTASGTRVCTHAAAASASSKFTPFRSLKGMVKEKNSVTWIASHFCWWRTSFRLRR